MLLGPEDGEQFGDPRVDGSQPMQASVARGADSDQDFRVADAGMPMVHVQVLVPRPTRLTPKFISIEDRLPVAAEIISRVPAHPITLRAEPGDCGGSFATGAEQQLLPKTRTYSSPQDTFRTRVEGRGCGTHKAIIRRT